MNKTKNISARVTEKEYEEIAKLAKKNSMKLSDYVVQSCLYQNTDANRFQNKVLLDIQKRINELKSGFIKKKDFVKEIERILKNHGIY